MKNKTQDEIIVEEVEAILDDIKALYNKSGKRTSGKFETGLKATYSPNKAIIEGYTYLAGRTAGKQPPIEAIKQWIKKKGIKPIKDKMTSTSLAWAIAKAIAKKGTDSSKHLKVYVVITPERIDSVIKKVSQFNVNLFVQELETQLNLLEKNI
jgi:hypothetical protein